ncbi:toll/interleukin-1 receptor domain-containing protein [Prosthecobacter sp.]|uniref:toll/interleukin-1 receptor domain-containing protein n=1 Tax=Prosthecobacter sp. TaxID=1965333 RepID=UPI003784DEF9
MVIKKGGALWNTWRARNTGTPVELGGSNLKGADLSRGNLSGANLKLTLLNDANLRGANLRGANLSEALLNDADLQGADLGGANLSGAELSDTSLNDVSIGRTVFTEVDLRTAKGLESVRHRIPSSVGIDTLYKSKGQIPDVFLRGCGVPDSCIAHAKVLMVAGEGIQFYSCFISYSTLDDEFARRLHGRLQQDHVRVWFSPHDIQGGRKLHEQIDEAIRVYDKLLIVLSSNSLRSEWVMTELKKARKAERMSGKRKLFPVRIADFQTLTEWECFDADSGQDLASEVRLYFIPDFSRWKEQHAFESGYARLLKDLRADEKIGAGAAQPQ